ncbi:MAG: chromosome segregation protein, partial [Actinomycetota bacterium]
EEAVTADAPLQARSQEAYVALAALRERFAGLRSLAAERLSGAEGPVQLEAGPDPEELERQAAAARAETAQLAEELARGTAELTRQGVQRRDAERALSAAEAGAHSARRAISERRERLAKLRGSVTAAQTKVDSRTAEIARLIAVIDEAKTRADDAEQAHREREQQPGEAPFEGGEGQKVADLAAAIDAARAGLAEVEAELSAARSAEASAGRGAAAAAARAEALRAGLARKDGSAALLADGAGIDGVLGRVAQLISVEHGHEVAIGAALGAVADAVAVADSSAAVAALAAVTRADGGRTHLLVAADDPADGPWPDLPPGAVYAIDVVTAEPRLRSALLRLLRRVAIVSDVAAARRLIAQADVVAVTAAGEVLSLGWAAAGTAESLLEVKAALDAAEAEAGAAADQREAMAANLAAAGRRHSAAVARLEQARSAKQIEDARLAAIAKELGGLGAAATAARNEVVRSERTLTQAQEQAQADRAAHEALQQRLAAAQAEPSPAEPDESVLAEAKAGVEAARTAEVEARLAVRTAEERHRVMGVKAGELAAGAAGVRRRRARAAEQQRQRQARAEAARAVLETLARVEPSVASAVEQAQADRAAAERVKVERDAELRTIRAAIRESIVESDRLNDSVHRDELAKAQQRVRIEAAQDKALGEFGIDPATLVAEYGPEQLVPPSGVAAGDAEDLDPDAPEPTAVPYIREQQEVRLRKAERELAALGRVNPLALEEFAALQERQAFLTEQLEDLKRSKADLLGIVSDVDERVRTVFAEAYADVAEQFTGVFARLFPGGEGRLVLTDPDDMLNTGIEVEARPAGKRVKRLSLLSGGERSLTAVAFLVSLFKARPSPFYLLDEVEAALDDVNLGRLIGIMEELRGTSQLLVITHQKRTMDIADALYGVTMRDGVSQVISQRMRELV